MNNERIEGVTEQLCQARMDAMCEKLDRIAEDARESREVGGKIMRKLFEGNGDSLASQVTASTKFRLDYEAEWKERLKEKRVRFWTFVGLSGGWALTLAKILWDAAH